MQFQFLISFFTLAVLGSAFQISDGLIKIYGRELGFSDIEQTTLPVVFNETNSKLDLSFKILGKTQPDQVFIKISNQDDVETSFKPIVKSTTDGYNAKLSISYDSLPSLFQISPSLKLHLIIAGRNDNSPIFSQISGIELTEQLISKNFGDYSKPDRFQPLPEIHHIFNQPPKTVNSGIAIIFSSLSIGVLVLLIAVWGGFGLINFQNFPSGGDLINHLIFIGLITSFEIVFFQYYWGSSIFSTIGKTALLLGPTAFFGAKVLNYVGALRLAGKR